MPGWIIRSVSHRDSLVSVDGQGGTRVTADDA